MWGIWPGGGCRLHNAYALCAENSLRGFHNLRTAMLRMATGLPMVSVVSVGRAFLRTCSGKPHVFHKDFQADGNQNNATDHFCFGRNQISKFFSDVDAGKA